jgi:glycosyltransferase involved in cell wall biosynthesis
MSKSLLIINRSFWPDIEATGQFFTELCEYLAKDYKVTVIAGRSYYTKDSSWGFGKFYKKEQYKGIKIIRVCNTIFWKGNLVGRLINWFTFGILSFLISLTISPRLIIVGTDPPFLGIIAMMVSRIKSTPFIYNCRDLYPEVAVAMGKIKKHSLLGRTFSYFDKMALNSARLVVCLGPTMENKLKAKGVSEDRLRVISDWVDTSLIKPIPKNENPLLKKLGLQNKFIIMYSGNIGFSQDFSSILQALSVVKEDIYLIFIGEGAAKKSLKSEVSSRGLKNVMFLSYQPLDALSFSLSMADLHLIPLKKGLAGTIVPSKIYGIMAAGRPYLTISDKESEAAILAKEFGCGLWGAPSEPNEIAQTISWAINHRDEIEKIGQAARQIAEMKFDKNIVMKEWLSVLENSS